MESTSDVNMTASSSPDVSSDVPMRSGLSTQVRPIIDRIIKDRSPYVGICKPGDLGHETWRAVLPSAERRGRGHKGQWETVVLSDNSKRGINHLLLKVKQLPGVNDLEGPVGVRHIVNPHCDLDEGLRIVWPGEADEEMDDWARRDEMMRAGKTVRPENVDGLPGGLLIGLHPQGFVPVVSAWDNVGWTTLG